MANTFNFMQAMDEDKDIEQITFSPSNKIDASIKKIALGFIEDAADLTYKFDAVDEKSKTKPDVIIGFKYKKNHINCLLFEVKRPTATSKYQAENAHVKLLKQMKTSIDFQVKIRINSPASFGVLCRGFECFLFRMSLVEDGIYLAIYSLAQVSIARRCYHIDCAVESISYAIEKVLAVQQKVSIKASLINKDQATSSKD